MDDKLTDVYSTARMDQIAPHLRHIGTTGECEICGAQVIYDSTSFETASVISKRRNRNLMMLCGPCCHNTVGPESAAAFLHLNNQAVSKEIARITAERQ